MPEVLVDRRVNLRASGHKQTEYAALRGQQTPVTSEFAAIVLDMFEHVDAQNRVPGVLPADGFDGSVDQSHIGSCSAKALGEPFIRLDSDQLRDIGKLSDQCTHLAYAGADLENAS